MKRYKVLVARGPMAGVIFKGRAASAEAALAFARTLNPRLKGDDFVVVELSDEPEPGWQDMEPNEQGVYGWQGF